MRSVLHDVYEQLPTQWVSKFFTRTEAIWSNYLQRQDAFQPESYTELQRQYQKVLDELLIEAGVAQLAEQLLKV
jgi:hypothetical protein